MLLEEQVAIVTGGTAGIGKGIAKKLAEHGAYVFIMGTNDDRGAQVVQELLLIPNCQGAAYYKVDVANFQEVEKTCKEIIEIKGKVDVLVNNAGVTKDQLLMKMSEQDWDTVMEVNVKSCYNTCHALVRNFMKARKGRIINISSIVGLTGNGGQVNYAASKAAIIGFTKALAKELAPRKILVNCVAPGFIETSMTDVLTETQKTAIFSQIPLERLGSTEDVANAVLFLASSLSDYITGQVITVDGGMVM